jgi:hypothetical protein
MPRGTRMLILFIFYYSLLVKCIELLYRVTRSLNQRVNKIQNY